MKELKIYRKRIIPQECILLKDDIIVKKTKDIIITTWNTLNHKIAFHHGCSCYFLKDGIKVSKFYRADNSLLYWYCDIVDYEFNEEENALVVTDLLADVIVDTQGITRVLDLDELADALEQGLLSEDQLKKSLRRLNKLLTIIYKDKFDRLQSEINNLGL